MITFEPGHGIRMAAEPAPAKRRRVELEDGQQEEPRKTLLSSLEKLADAINRVVNETRAEYAAASGDVEKFVSGPAGPKRGIRNLWSHVANYVECLRANGVTKYSDLEELWKRHYSRQEIRDAVEDVLEAEESHQSLLQEVEGPFIETQSSTGTGEVWSTGDCVCGDLEVTDARSSEVKEVRSYWEGSKVTLFVLLRHFG